ncbi:MAG: TrkH family potassium uptake protein [Clostridia bacterium]|nr:TrkH family potassium uptake protein [Clostridia bacterium]
MNYKVVFSILGKALLIEAGLMLVPLLVGVLYQENNYLAFLIPILSLLIVGFPLSRLKSKDNSLYAKEGFVIVALSWILLSLFGAIPFVINGVIPNYIDAVFETVSGFTTTGSTILNGEQIENMNKGLLFWRQFTHWIGGMGILVFVLAILPANNAGVMHVFRSEAPGPSVDKLSTKLKFTARILYGIYIVLTLIQVIMLACGGLSILDSFLMSLSTAGTGGFGILGDSAISYSSYIQIVLSVFMFLFALNFNIYYLLLIGNVSKVFALEEVRTFFIIVLVAVITIAINLFTAMSNIYATFGDALKHSFFQVTSISSTTGLASADFNTWPSLSKGILLVLTIIGACGGSTGGGIKMSRMIILCKSSTADFKKLIHPRAVVYSKLEGEPIPTSTERNVRTFFIVWVMIVIVSTMLLSVDPHLQNDIFSGFSATLACIGNVGPGFNVVGPMFNYMGFSYFSKIVLSFVMLIGRLEIFPMLILFIPRTWRKG